MFRCENGVAAGGIGRVGCTHRVGSKAADHACPGAPGAAARGRKGEEGEGGGEREGGEVEV